MMISVNLEYMGYSVRIKTHDIMDDRLLMQVFNQHGVKIMMSESYSDIDHAMSAVRKFINTL